MQSILCSDMQHCCFKWWYEGIHVFLCKFGLMEHLEFTDAYSEEFDLKYILSFSKSIKNYTRTTCYHFLTYKYKWKTYTPTNNTAMSVTGMGVHLKKNTISVPDPKG